MYIVVEIYPNNAEICLYKPWKPKRFFRFEIIINVLALCASFEYLCHGSTAIINILLLSARGSSLYVKI